MDLTQIIDPTQSETASNFEIVHHLVKDCKNTALIIVAKLLSVNREVEISAFSNQMIFEKRGVNIISSTFTL